MMAKRQRPVCREHHRPDNKCMSMAAPGSDRCALHHLEAYTRLRAVNRQLGRCGCGADPDPGYRSCARCRVWSTYRKRCQRHPELRMEYETQQFIRAYRDHGNAARAVREAKLGTGLGARRKGYRLLQKGYIRAKLDELKAATLDRERQQVEEDARSAALTREVELDRLARLELAALLEIDRADREQGLLIRLHREAMRGAMNYRAGSRGGAQSQFARVCRQYNGEPAHREPGQCCCGQPATSPRGASCDRCRERDRHYRRRYRARRESQKRESA